MALNVQPQVAVRQQPEVPFCWGTLQPMVALPKSPAHRAFMLRMHQAMDSLRIEERGRPAWLAKRLKITVTGAQKYLNGLSMPHQRRWQKVADALDVSVLWLRDNVGPMKLRADPLFMRLQALWFRLPETGGARERLIEFAEFAVSREKPESEHPAKTKTEI